MPTTMMGYQMKPAERVAQATNGTSWPVRFALCLAFVISTDAVLLGQVKPNDFTRRADDLGDRRVNPKVVPLKRNESIPDKRIKPPILRKVISGKGGRRAKIAVSETRAKKVKTYPVRRMPAEQPSPSPLKNRRARIDGWDNRFHARDRPAYGDLPVVTLKAGNRQIANAYETLTLDDFNRYQFRRNRAGKDGIPVQQAGRGRRTKAGPKE
jgi:hypothetical protein